VSLHRYSKRAIIILIDLGLCALSTWLAFILRLEELILLRDFNFFTVITSMVIAIPIFWLFGLYRTIIRYTNLYIIFAILASTFVYGLLYFLVIGVYSIQGVPRSIGVIQPMLLFLGVICTRFIAKFILTIRPNNKKDFLKKNILIYGAGQAGGQLCISLENSIEFNVIGFVDDNQQLHKQYLYGKNIYSPVRLDNLIVNKNISIIFLAIPGISRIKRNNIIKNLNRLKVKVQTLPSISEIVDGRITLSDIKDLNIEDLLNRDEVKPDIELLNKNINSKVVMVTGAGGSIGSEILRHIIKLKPKKLILIELNEFALYKISEELKNFNQNIKIISLLLSVQNKSKFEEVFEIFKVDTVYHAAAYKHVPLVEENICESVNNNVFGTFNVAQCVIKYKVDNFVLISSDKAVRPTNIMGATKRLSEICVQSLYESENHKSKFAIVRFGNVLESSGSVIPKFKQQIKEGGPVTLTHPDVTRYFMTITEASQLVIQAGAMAEKCEVFVLDMGESVKIKELINKMIKLSGLLIKNSKNLDGDIEIKTIGLRPGEKLYEELLIGENPQKTYHEKIQKAQDPFIPFKKLKTDLDELSNLLKENKVENVKNLLSNLVSSYHSNSKIVDHFYKQQTKSKNDLKSSKIVNKETNKVVSIKTK
jgi:FlaA1/EpsC-like NDP-sugar epimerase